MIETSRLTLRLATEDDVQELIRYHAENAAHLAPWSPASTADVLSADYWEDQIALRRAEFDARLGARFFIFPRDGGGRVAGNVALTQIARFPQHSCYLGYGLAAWAVGRGFMTEAVRATVAYAWAELGLHRVMANYMPHNLRSAAVLRRCGFVVEGYARDYLLIAGRWEDHLLTAITNPEWSGGGAS